MADLFDPIQVGTFEVKNRVVFAATGTGTLTTTDRSWVLLHVQEKTRTCTDSDAGMRRKNDH